MRIVYFYQYFATSKGSWGTRVYEFAKIWVEKGHKVTVVTSIYSKSDLRASKLIETQYFDGIEVKVINIAINNKHSFFKRVLGFCFYSLLSCWYALVLKADVVIASSGPITIGIPGMVAKYLRGRKLVFEVRDLWPEGVIELGILKNKTIQKLSYWFEKRCYKAASLVVTLSPGMSKNINRRFPSVKVIDVTNAANIGLFSQINNFDSALVTSKKYAIYTGNIGEVNNSYWLYEAAKCLKMMGYEDIIILLVGEGQQREELEKRAAEEEVTNFKRFGLMPKKDLVKYVQHAMVSLVPLKGTPVLDTSSPNKFFESLAAGVPVIQNTQGWMKDFLEINKVGFTLNPNDPQELAEKLIWMDKHSQIVQEMGIKAADVARKNFDKDILAQKMLSAIEAL